MNHGKKVPGQLAIVDHKQPTVPDNNDIGEPDCFFYENDGTKKLSERSSSGFRNKNAMESNLKTSIQFYHEAKAYGKALGNVRKNSREACQYTN